MSDSTERLSTALADRYAIARELGAGGMATVYLAHDIKHDRDVAIKVLHADLGAALGSERFLSEIRTTARLQHPHILPLLDSGEADGLLYYVMPLVTGETLRSRLERERQLPIDDAVLIAREVADALGYAHELGVIHRDIKPENILLQGGHALVADFGIALAVQSAGGARMTQTGLSLGTPQYMSPEQAMGERTIDARSDIYALGAVTYEMLVGEPPFTGPSVQAIVARLVTEEPRAISVQRKAVPPEVEAAVLRALEKLPADRFATAPEFAAALTAPSRPAPRNRTASTSGHQSRGIFDPLRWTWIPAAIIAAAGAWWFSRHDVTPEPTVSASLITARDCGVAPVNSVNLIQLSPDGSSIVYVGQCNGVSSLWVRTIASGAAHALTGTTNPFYPFWSPDGRSVGFFASGRLKRIDLASGAVRDLAASPNGRGGSWSPSGDIVYAPDIFGPLYRVPAAGGTATIATALAPGSRVTDRMPYFLPDGRHFLFIESAGVPWDGTVLAGTLGSLATQRILDVPSNVAFAKGRLFYVRDGALFAEAFAPNRLHFTGAAVAVANNVETWPFRDLGNFTVQGRLLIYRQATDVRRRIDWFDPRTRVITPAVPVGSFQSIRLSPDGGTLLVDRNAPDSPLVDAWSYRFDSREWTQLTTHPEVYYSLAWSRDSKFFSLQGSDDSMVQVRRPDRGDSATYGPGIAGSELIADWAPGDSVAVGTRQVTATGFDLMRLALKSHAQSQVFLATAADEERPLIDPSGTLISYLSNQNGQTQAYVTTFPLASEQHAISPNSVEYSSDVASPLAWAPGGHTLYVLENAQRLVSVKINRSPAITIDSLTPVDGAPHDILSIAVAPDGQLLLLYADVAAVVPFTVLTNWPAVVR